MQTQVINSDQLENASTVKQVIEQSYLNPWSISGLYLKDEVTNSAQQLCDFAIHHPSALILISDKQLEIAHEQGQTKNKVRKARQTTAFKAHHNFVLALATIKNPKLTIYQDKDCLVPLDIPEDIPVYFVCITVVQVAKGDKRILVRHNYSSDFFIEESILDFDENDAAQLFSLESFVKILQVLQNLSDLTRFFNFYKDSLIEGVAFDNETALLKAFIASGKAFEQARQIENQLVTEGLRPSVDTSLALTDENELTNTFFKMLENGKFWNNIINAYAQNLSAEKLNNADSTHRKLLAALSAESAFSKNNLVRLIVEYIKEKGGLKQTGYMVHARSYENKNRHYVFLFYATDKSLENHRKNAMDKLGNIASAVNHRFQNPPLEEIIVIGLEDNHGQLSTDMYYTPGQIIENNSPQDTTTAPANLIDMIAPSGVREVKQPNNAKQAYDRIKQFNRGPKVKAGIKKLKINQSTPKITNQSDNTHVGRNAPCPCGSGKRFRHCHGAIFDYKA